ncbi:GNAT family N-acetyltransferase [Pseudomonas sp. GM30]|uniref:GNAT family N-acetyltransferase n=1 Tax=Pseudomonas sp. GM30 TaxID=1144328 RepID=UPI0002701C8E|nr:GNAT family N-acetyltransferase [Pseudomonas sp. GM30]EUB82886.1 GCN5-related N-acetyltransferase [Pseudomonas sp. GM30]
MEASICICPAKPADAGLISRIIERSIRVGCALDHRNDPQQVSHWIGRQSADVISAHLADAHCYLNIALLQDKPVGVGMATTSGDIGFCHVQPEWFRRGAGRALMTDLEGWLRIRGVAQACIASTRSGAAFYRHLGYRELAPAFSDQGLHRVALHKPLVVPD